jgi:hypothetical protein
MARKIKVPNEHLKRFAREEQKRKKDIRNKRKYYLIVCENIYNRTIDRLWVVFDRDSFSPNDFNNAVHRCQNVKPVIGCAWSNEAFELWYLLHFHYYNNGMSRKDYQDAIELV